ncbi:MAG: glutamine-hydrolyzing GMP synthase [Spirochaetales bacterium]
MRKKIVVLDFGSQYAHLIAKRIRFLGYYCEIALPSVDIESLKDAKGIILSGGPSSVYEKNLPEFNEKIFELPVPVLGLCYGHQLMAKYYGGEVQKAQVGEFGLAHIKTADCPKSPLFDGLSSDEQVWMSHNDEVTSCPDGFDCIAFTKHCAFAGLQNTAKKRFSLQFHAEVKDSPCGNTVFQNFVQICEMEQNWNQDTVLETVLENIQTEAGDRNILLFLSGGVDSTVSFALLNKALGKDRVLGLHIDNGFMRKDESKHIAQRYHSFGFSNFIIEDASAEFLQAVLHETGPQKKRLAVGETFLTVRDEVMKKQNLQDGAWMLAQGTLYPDIIESGGTKNAHVIKTHHNRVDGIQKLIDRGLIIEPLKDLYKDEVRRLGVKLSLSDELVFRHPFPGPGLSINVLCSNGILLGEDKTGKSGTEELKKAKEEFEALDISAFFDNTKIKKIEKNILPVKSVGVQGDFRTYRFPAVLHSDFEFFPTPEEWAMLEKLSAYITNNVHTVNRTILCLYEKENCSLKESYCTKDRLDQIREVDAIVLDTLKANGLYSEIFQHLTINLPYYAEDTHCSIVLRPVVSEDVMTARFAHLSADVLKIIAEKIQKLNFVDALYYDITNKPPATFGWE